MSYITNLETFDATFIVHNLPDQTKELVVDLNSATTLTRMTFNLTQTVDRIITFPDATGTLITTNSTDTLTNKTISDASNTVGANELRTTGASVVIDTAAPPLTGQILRTISATSAEWVNSTLYFQGFLTTQTSITTIPTNLPIETEIIKDSPFTHTASSPNVTVSVAGDYIITVSVSVVSIGGNNRSNVDIWLNVDTGSGFTEVLGTRRLVYVRTVNFGATMAFERYITVSAGDIFKVQGDRTNGTTNTVVRNGQYLFLIRSA